MATWNPGGDPAFILMGIKHFGGHLASCWARSIYFAGLIVYWWEPSVSFSGHLAFYWPLASLWERDTFLWWVRDTLVATRHLHGHPAVSLEGTHYLGGQSAFLFVGM